MLVPPYLLTVWGYLQSAPMEVVLMLEQLNKLPEGSAATSCTHSYFDRVVHIGGREVRIVQDFGEGGVAMELWRCGEVFARDVTLGGSLHLDWRGKYVLELGAGLGLLGIGLALQGARVVSTDVPEVVPAMRRNIEKNLLTRNLRADTLDWLQKPPDEIVETAWDVVVAADVVYSPFLFDGLISTLEKVSGRHTLIVLVYQKRDHTDEFFEKLWKAKFVLHEQHTILYEGVTLYVFLIRPPGQPSAADVHSYYCALSGIP